MLSIPYNNFIENKDTNMNKRFESIKKGTEQAIAWKKGKKTTAKVRKYSALDITRIKEKTKNSKSS